VTSVPDGGRAQPHGLEHAFAPAGWAVVRTPVLPFERFTELTAGRSSDAEVRRAIRDAFALPMVREALALASPGLLARALAEPPEGSGAGAGNARFGDLTATLYRYLARMAWRCTPFGLFAAVSVGSVGVVTAGGSKLDLRSREDLRPVVRATFEEVVARIARGLEQVPAGSVPHRVNTSWYLAGARVRFAELARGPAAAAGFVDTAATERLVSVLRTGGALDRFTLDELAGASEARASYVASLARIGLVVPDVFPASTAADPVTDALERMQGHAALAPIVADLQALQAGAARMAARVTAALRGAAATASAAGDGDYHVDLHREAEVAIAPELAREVLGAIALLDRFDDLAPDEELATFRELFDRRFGTAWVPLPLALDPDQGVPFGSKVAAGSPWTADLPLLPEAAAPEGRWTSHSDTRLRLLVAAAADRSHADLTAVLPSATQPARALPDSLLAIVQILAAGPDALARHDYDILLRLVGSVGGVGALGRFCATNDALRALVAEHCRREQALAPEVIFADLAHEPAQQAAGNMLLRPPLQPYEIVYRATPGVVPRRRIAIGDLVLGLRGGALVLWSVRHDREVRVRIMNAHSPRASQLPLYRFLHRLSTSGPGVVRSWSWGPLSASDWLPRVVAGRVILAPARWTLRAPEIDPGRAADPGRAVDALRDKHRLPRWVVVRTGEQAMPIDLASDVGARVLLETLRGAGAGRMVLEECLPAADQLCASSRDGLHAHEVMIPFLRRSSGSPADARARPSSTPRTTTELHPPGSEWFFVKAYCAPLLLEPLLLDLSRIARAHVAAGAADRWFFVRYRDPDFHVRLRIRRAGAGRVDAEVLEALKDATARGVVWKVQLDTYVPETERFGGPHGLELFHEFSWLDSEAVVDALSIGPGDVDARIVASSLAIDRYATSFGLSLDERLALARTAAEVLAPRVAAGVETFRELARRFRAHAGLLADAFTARSPPWAALAAVFERAHDRLGVAWRRALERGLLAPRDDVVRALFHMHVNRYQRTYDPLHELVTYDALFRFYRAAAGRAKHGSRK
jgi:thiopeptide-type bacteriocin biosynthesis protein